MVQNQKVLLIPGNHETIATADFLAELYGMKNIHGYSVEYGDVGPTGSPPSEDRELLNSRGILNLSNTC